MPDQKAQVHDDMHNTTIARRIERMLETADHWIEKHQGPERHQGLDKLQEDSSLFGRTDPQLPAGWIVYSACYETGGAKKGWNVELLGAATPHQNSSIVDGWDRDSLDSALHEASRKIPAAA